MCSQADDPSQHVSDDTLRAAILAADALHIENHGESCDCDVAPYLDPLAALAASATDEYPGDKITTEQARAMGCGCDRCADASATDEGPSEDCGIGGCVLAVDHRGEHLPPVDAGWVAQRARPFARPAVPEALDTLRGFVQDVIDWADVPEDLRQHARETLARPAVPEALDVERLARAIWLVQHNTAADHYDRNVPPGSPHRAEVDEVGDQVAREYAALRSKDPT